MEEIVMTKADLEQLVKDAVKAAEDNRRHNQLPAAFAGQTRDEARSNAKHILGFIKAASKGDVKSLEALYNERPDFYEGVNKAVFTGAADATGGYTVPTVWVGQIFSNVEKYGFARKIGNVYPMPSKDVKFTTGGGVTVSWPGADTAPTPFDATGFFAQTTLTAATMAAAAIVSKDLLDDTNVELINYLSTQYGIAIAREEDTQFFKGSGSPHTGIISTSGVNVARLGGSATSGKTAFSNISWTDLIDLKLAVNTSIQSDGVYVIPQTVLGYLLKEKDAENRPIQNQAMPASQPNIGVDAAPYSYNGSPMYVVPDALFPTSAVTTTCAIFGSFKQFGLLGVRQDLSMETFDQAYAGVDLSGKRQIALQVTERIGVAFPVPTAFALLKTSAS